MKKNTEQPKTRSEVALAAWNRPGGVHADQHKRKDAKRLRRDKSYKRDW